MTWEDFWMGVGLALLTVVAVLLVASTWIFQMAAIIIVFLARNFKWLVLGGTAITIAWIVTQ